MCGIAGIHAYSHAANGVDQRELLTMRDYMAARGPDASGLWLSKDERVVLGHRRLAIIDLSANGRQPMQTQNGHLVVTFNGEIYNFRELRAELERKGYHFRTNSDTEVLLHLYADRGVDMVRSLRGMFAFGFWDALAKQLLLSRDPYGIKPLYYADDGGTFRFASQVKALVSGGVISRDPDAAGQVGFYLFGSVPEPFTTYRAIRSVPAGTTMTVNANGPGAPRQYHSISKTYYQAERCVGSAPEAPQAVQAAVLDSVRHHLVADVPVGAFLSAGIDSGALVGLMRDAGANDIKTVTIRFEEFQGTAEDEAPLAAEVAALYGTEHTLRVVKQSEFEADLPKIFKAMDQPSIDGINTWFVSKAASELGLKVAISGLGGDELFGGYPSFTDLPRWARAFGPTSRIPLLGSAVRSVVHGIGAHRLALNPKAAGLLELGGTYAGGYLLRRGLFMPWELSEVLNPETVAEGLQRLKPLELIGRAFDPCPRDPFARVATLESSLYMRNQLLRDADWASMAHSIEVRLPLADSVLLAFMARNTNSVRGLRGKQLLAEAPSASLPTSVAKRTKTGFETPIAKWMRSRVDAKVDAKDRSVRRSIPWAREWSRIVDDAANGSM